MRSWPEGKVKGLRNRAFEKGNFSDRRLPGCSRVFSEEFRSPGKQFSVSNRQLYAHRTCLDMSGQAVTSQSIYK